MTHPKCNASKRGSAHQLYSEPLCDVINSLSSRFSRFVLKSSDCREVGDGFEVDWRRALLTEEAESKRMIRASVFLLVGMREKTIYNLRSDT